MESCEGQKILNFFIEYYFISSRESFHPKRVYPNFPRRRKFYFKKAISRNNLKSFFFPIYLYIACFMYNYRNVHSIRIESGLCFHTVLSLPLWHRPDRSRSLISSTYLQFALYMRSDMYIARHHCGSDNDILLIQCIGESLTPPTTFQVIVPTLTNN